MLQTEAHYLAITIDVWTLKAVKNHLLHILCILLINGGDKVMC